MITSYSEIGVVVLDPGTSNTLSATRKCSYEPRKVLLVSSRLAMPSLHRELSHPATYCIRTASWLSRDLDSFLSKVVEPVVAPKAVVLMAVGQSEFAAVLVGRASVGQALFA